VVRARGAGLRSSFVSWLKAVRLRLLAFADETTVTVPPLRRVLGALPSSMQTELEVAANGRRRAAADQPAAVEYRLRRSTHRLEKGLSVDERRPVFGEAFIEQFVDDLITAHRTDATSPAVRWASAVAAEYFDAVGAHAAPDSPVRRARRQWAGAALTEPEAHEPPLVPYKSAERPPLPFGYDELLELVQRRRSIRSFDERPVPRALVEDAVRIARQAPSACNRQPFRFVIVDGADQVAPVLSLALGATGFSRTPPALAVVVADWSAYVDGRDRHTPYVDASLASMLLMLGAESVGLSTCPVNWPEVRRRDLAMREAIGLARWEKPVLLIAIGYATDDGLVPASAKKSIDALIERIDT